MIYETSDGSLYTVYTSDPVATSGFEGITIVIVHYKKSEEAEVKGAFRYNVYMSRRGDHSSVVHHSGNVKSFEEASEEAKKVVKSFILPSERSLIT